MSFSVTIRHKEPIKEAIKKADEYAERFFGDKVFVLEDYSSYAITDGARSINKDDHQWFNTRFDYFEIKGYG